MTKISLSGHVNTMDVSIHYRKMKWWSHKSSPRFSDLDWMEKKVKNYCYLTPTKYKNRKKCGRLLSNYDSWNVRDRHMMETLETLIEHHRKPTNQNVRCIIWAHNTHIWDFKATDMAKSGLVSIGVLARERFGHSNIDLVGFGTYGCFVTASLVWDGPIQRLEFHQEDLEVINLNFI